MSRLINITIVVFVVSFLSIIDTAFSEERRNPFKNWFPVIKKEEPVVENKPVIIYEQEKKREKERFDVSIYKVNGLIWGAYESKAIINDKIYVVGDKLGRAEITKINKEGVTLILEGDEHFITTKQAINIRASKEEQGVDNES